MSNNPISGFSYLLKGFGQLNRPGLKRYVYIPLLINIVIYIIVISLAGHYFADLLQWIMTKLPSWLHWLDWLLWPLFILAAGIFIIYTFVVLANLIGAPFNSLLAEKLELLETGKKLNEDESIWSSVKDIPRSIKRQLAIIAYTIPRVLILLVLFLIPGINIVASILWFLFGGWTMALQYMDYPMDNHRIPFAQMRSQMRKANLRYLAFGCGTAVITLIPIINFVAMPAAVIGATLMYLDKESSSAKKTNEPT